MYKLFYIIGLIVRQFVLPNPFTPFGDNAEIINWVVGALFVPITYFMVGAIYDRGSEPAWGCILFNIIYAVNTGITYLVCLAYPMIWLMVAIAVAYLVLYFFVACRIHNLIYEGKFKARKPKMIQLMGQIADSRGKEFNDSIFERIKQMNEFEVSKNISEVNKKRIATQEGNVLGDIDVLVIDHKNKTIICAEVKDFNFSRNPYEVHQEYLKMFDHQKGYYYKHQKRVHWCAEHISDFVTQYNLSDAPWKVFGTFIVSEPLGSNEIYDKEVSVITEAELSVGALRRISCCQ